MPEMARIGLGQFKEKLPFTEFYFVSDILSLSFNFIFNYKILCN